MDYFKKNGLAFEEGLDLNYLQTESQLRMVQDENGDLVFLVDDEDSTSASIISYQTNYLTSILAEYYSIVWIVILTRILHFIIDSIKPGSNHLKDLVTCTTGLTQLERFINKVEVDSHGRQLTYSVIIIYFTYSKYSNLLFDKRKPRGRNRCLRRVISLIVIFTPILVNEHCIHMRALKNNTFLRSILMTLAMKATSQLSSPNTGTLSILAYFLHPASCIFGPWHIRTTDHRFDDGKNFVTFKQQIVKSIRLLIQTISILFVSDCLLDYVVDRLEYYQETYNICTPLVIFFRAQQFRFSHYSFCYLTLSMLSLWANPVETFKICNILKVEWPRSLVQVVISWNIPMHIWLRDHIFKPAKNQFENVPLAILITYLVSSTLHGIKFHIWAVLLSLGLLTLVEFELRKKLACRLNACILAKDCRVSSDGDCIANHKLTKKNSIRVKIINLSFSILAIFHLAYLGYIFKQNTDQASYIDALETWRSVYYYSPIIGLVTLLINICLI